MIDYGYGVSLDTIEFDDIEIMRQTRNFSMINRWCRQCGLISRSEQGAWWERLQSDKTRKIYIIVTANAERIGVVGLTDIDHRNQNAEFSLLINPKNQSRGYGKLALKTILKHGFDDLNLNVIWGETYEGNHALKLFTAVGMTLDGIRPQHVYKDGKFFDSYMISIKREAFKALTKIRLVSPGFDDADASRWESHA